MLGAGGSWAALRAPTSTGTAQQPADPFAVEGFVLERTEARTAVPEGLEFVLENPFGDLRLRHGGGRDSELVVLATVQQFDGFPRLELVQSADSRAVRVAVQRVGAAGSEAASGSQPSEALAPGPHPRADLVAFLPEGVVVRISGSDGLIDVRKTVGDLHLKTQSGTVNLRSVRGDLNVQTASADVQVFLEPRTEAGPQKIRTDSGDVSLFVNDHTALDITLETGGWIATDYSMQVERRHSPELGVRKKALLEVGKPVSAFSVTSQSGTLRVVRRLLPAQARASGAGAP
jgi:hypothetical protein